jgi:hypothetical protein
MLETIREREGERSRESERGDHKINNKLNCKHMPSLIIWLHFFRFNPVLSYRNKGLFVSSEGFSALEKTP